MAYHPKGVKSGWRKWAFLTGALTVLAVCEEGAGFNPFKPQPEAGVVTKNATSSVKLVERDVEAPDVFQVTDRGLWDGRPSLGGVWVAHPDVKEPERVIIRNNANSKFVIGALFRRERENPGPVLQVSSDAAAALGMLAGAPSDLNVTALRRETAPDPSATMAMQDVPTQELPAAAQIEATALDPVAGAAAAIEAVETIETKTASTEDFKPVKPVKPVQKASSLEKPFIQIGIFSVEQNAKNTAEAMRVAGMVPTVKEQSSKGKTFWRVIVGPATNAAERSSLLKKAKGVGFEDAYAVTN